MGKNFVLAACAAAIAFTAVPANATLVKVGTADTGSSIPFDTYLGGYYFSQIYSKAQFGTGGSINQISFYNTAYPGGNPGTGNFTLWLGTSSAAIPTFDNGGNFVFPDASFTQVFSGALPSVASGALTLNLSTAFNYDASQNLVLIVRNTDLSGDGNLFLDYDNNSTAYMNSRFSAYNYDNNGGLVTGFNVAPVPEPASWALMVGGLGIAGGMLRNRRRLSARFA